MTNIEILKDNQINISKIIKYDETILFIDNKKLKNIINIYLKYDINLTNDYYNFEFLKEDYSNIIDKFIEIGEYNFIKENASLINPDSNIIIKRCILYKEIGNNCFNEQGKLRGNLRKEENFLLNDLDVSETIIENFLSIIPKEIIEILNSDNEMIDLNLNLNCLEEYKLDNYSYKFGNMIISKFKILKNLKILYKNNINDYYNFDELYNKRTC